MLRSAEPARATHCRHRSRPTDKWTQWRSKRRCVLSGRQPRPDTDEATVPRVLGGDPGLAVAELRDPEHQTWDRPGRDSCHYSDGGSDCAAVFSLGAACGTDASSIRAVRSAIAISLSDNSRWSSCCRLATARISSLNCAASARLSSRCCAARARVSSILAMLLANALKLTAKLPAKLNKARTNECPQRHRNSNRRQGETNSLCIH